MVECVDITEMYSHIIKIHYENSDFFTLQIFSQFSLHHNNSRSFIDGSSTRVVNTVHTPHSLSVVTTALQATSLNVDSLSYTIIHIYHNQSVCIQYPRLRVYYRFQKIDTENIISMSMRIMTRNDQ